tara:strand:+ start:2160 stop:2660 length:501 start_codon:yes stop_codon:yes gene_type:complete
MTNKNTAQADADDLVARLEDEARRYENELPPRHQDMNCLRRVELMQEAADALRTSEPLLRDAREAQSTSASEAPMGNELKLFPELLRFVERMENANLPNLVFNGMGIAKVADIRAALDRLQRAEQALREISYYTPFRTHEAGMVVDEQAAEIARDYFTEQEARDDR